MDTQTHRHIFVFNESDNGGEQLILTTTYYDNGDPEPITTQELDLQSYCNSAGFSLCGVQLTSNNLRELAKQLDKAKAQAKRNARTIKSLSKSKTKK